MPHAIVTARLRLRPLTSGDAADLVALLNDWRMVRYTSNIPYPYTLPVARNFIAESRALTENGKALVFAVEDRMTGALAACVGAVLEGRSAEIGYWVGCDFWGRGYAGEALAKLITLLFEECGASEVRAEILPENALSRRVARQQGLTQRGRRRVVMSARGDAAATFDILALDRATFFARKKARPHLLVAAAALIDEKGAILLAQRPEGKSMAGFWEFPGGKVEPGESPEEALARELMEELGLKAEIQDLVPFTFCSHNYDSFHLTMPLFLCQKWSGTPLPKEGQALEWARPEEMSGYLMPPADLPLVEKLLGRF